jgi:cytochrome c5
MDDEEVATRIQPVGRVHLEKAAAASTEARSGEDVVKSACSACHSTGAAGAPTIGNKAEWAPRIAKGLDGLLETAKNGLNAMPARGASNASDLELARAVVFMANQSGANFSEPSE